MGRARSSENAKDPATGRPLSPGVGYRGPFQYRARKLIDGKPVARTFETDNLAREWLEETAAKVREGSFVDRRALDKSTLAELVQRYADDEMKDGGRRRGAAEDRTGHIPAIKGDKIGALPLSKVTVAEVRGFRDRQLRTFAAGTVVKRLNLLASILAHAMGEWDIPLALNPASGKLVKRPDGADVKRDRCLLPPSAADVRAAVAKGDDPPKHEEDRLLEAIAKSDFPDDVPVTKLAIAQAMRQGEILALRWEDIDFDAKVIKVRGRHGLGTKSGQHRKSAKRKSERGWEIRPLMPGAIAILLKHRGDKEPDPKSHVFTVGSPNSFKVRIGRMITRAGLEDLTFHDLRHEATSRLAKRYPNPMDLKRVTGHLTLKSLDRYYQPDLSELAEQSSITSPVVPASLPSLGVLADVEAFAVADSVQSMP
jgi:integrase